MTTAYLFVGGITTLLVLLVIVLIRTLSTSNRREMALGQERAILAAANAELAAAKARADEKAGQLEATLAGMSDGVAMIDGNMQLVEWNHRFPEIAMVPRAMLRVGLPMEEILRAQAAGGVFGDVDIEAEVARRVTILRAGIYPSTFERDSPDGRVIELRRNRLPDGGFVTLYSDVTARRESVNALREASALAEAATKAMSRFVAIVSHEIRTPLNALLNSLKLLADSGMGSTHQALVETARRSGDALQALIDDVLEMSRLEAGQFALRPSIFALRPLIEGAIGIFCAQSADRRIALRASVAKDVPDELYEDPGRLRQVLINLLSNAVKFAAPGEVRVMAALRQFGDERRLHLAVRDRGPVISEASRARLFEPFSRLEEDSYAAPLGTGLGLAICRHLVALMGGEIGCTVWRVGSRDAGNEFWLTLPLRPIPTHARAGSPRADLPWRRRLPRTRVLLVEDIPANQLVTAMLLRRAGHLVDIADNGQDAISALAKLPYDLVLMDIVMPGMTGFDVTRRIRGMIGPPATAPVVALTANICPEDQAACAAAGMNDVLGKPVAQRDLLDAIARHVWSHRIDQLPAETVDTPVKPSQAQPLSPARLDELRAALPAETLANLVEQCLSDLCDRLVTLQEAMRHRDVDLVFSCTHAMAGLSAEYGMPALEARLRALIDGLKQEPECSARLLEGLEAELSRAGTALRDAFRSEMA